VPSSVLLPEDVGQFLGNVVQLLRAVADQSSIFHPQWGMKGAP
jgi:hypothetical protein